MACVIDPALLAPPPRKYPHRLDGDIVMPPGVGALKGVVSVVPIAFMASVLDPANDKAWWGIYDEIGHGHQTSAWRRIGNTSDVSNTVGLAVVGPQWGCGICAGGLAA